MSKWLLLHSGFMCLNLALAGPRQLYEVVRLARKANRLEARLRRTRLAIDVAKKATYARTVLKGKRAQSSRALKNDCGARNLLF